MNPNEFWLDIEHKLWEMISIINHYHYSRPHDVDNFAFALAKTNDLLKKVQENPPPFNQRTSEVDEDEISEDEDTCICLPDEPNQRCLWCF
jgi:uncharacterized UPF0160 family protein